jgi:hypothetical protein
MAKTPRTRTTAPPTNQSIVAASGQLNGRSDEAEKLSPRLELVSARTRCRTSTQGRRSCSQGFRISSSSRRHEQPGARQSPFPVPAQRRTPRPNQQTRATSHSPQARPLFSRALSHSIRKPPKPQGNRSQARPVSSFRKLPPTFSSFLPVSRSVLLLIGRCSGSPCRGSAAHAKSSHPSCSPSRAGGHFGRLGS